MTDLKIKRNFKIFVLYKALLGFAPYALIGVLYFEKLLDSYALAMGVFSFMFLSSSAMEIPMGVMSDYIGRRKTMILGALGYFLSILCYLVPSFYDVNALAVLFLGSFIQGTGLALLSGTDEALIYETAKALGDKYDFKKYYSRGRSFEQMSLAISAFISGFIVYYYSYEYCYIVSLFTFGIWFLISFWWVDVNESAIEKGNNVFAHVWDAIKLFKKNAKLKYLSIASIIDESSGLAVHRFEIVYYQMLIPEYLYGVPRALKQALGAVSFALSAKIINRLSAIKTMIYATIGLTFFRFVPLLINNFVTPFLASVTNFFYGPIVTAETDLLQKEFSNSQRATMRSLIGMGSSLLFAVFAVALGWVADVTSARAALFYILIFKLVIIAIYVKVSRLK